MRDSPFTDTERALLRKIVDRVGPVIASPDYEIKSLISSEGFRGGHGFECRFTKTAIVATWHEFIEAAWFPDGRPKQWRYGQQLGDATITYARLSKWARSLPAEVRAQAVVWWRTYPEDTRDLAALAELTLGLLADPEPVALPEPQDLLELLELMTNA